MSLSNQSKQRLSLQFCFLGHFSLFLFLFQIFQNVTVCMCVCVWVCVCVCVCVFMYIILHLRSYDPLIGCMSPVLEHFRTLEAFVSLSLLFALLLLLLFLLIFFPPSLSFSLFLTHTHIYTHSVVSSSQNFLGGGKSILPVPPSIWKNWNLLSFLSLLISLDFYPSVSVGSFLFWFLFWISYSAELLLLFSFDHMILFFLT